MQEVALVLKCSTQQVTPQVETVVFKLLGVHWHDIDSQIAENPATPRCSRPHVMIKLEAAELLFEVGIACPGDHFNHDIHIIRGPDGGNFRMIQQETDDTPTEKGVGYT